MFIFGTHLKELRKSRNVTQKKLATAIGASERGIQQYELGERKPTYDMLIVLADYFDVSLDYLVGRSESPYMLKGENIELLSPDEQEALRRFREKQ